MELSLGNQIDLRIQSPMVATTIANLLWWGWLLIDPILISAGSDAGSDKASDGAEVPTDAVSGMSYV